MVSSPAKSCAVPLWVLFTAGCVLVVISFTTVSTYSGVRFVSNINSAVDGNLDLALRGAMQIIHTPLMESARYLGRLKGKVEDNPLLYGVDDEYGATLESASTRGYIIDALPTAFQRNEISAIFQIRKSTRFFHGPGNPVDIIAIAAMPSKQVIFRANNTLTIASFANMSQLSNVTAVPSVTVPSNASGASYLATAYAAPSAPTWTVGVLQVAGYPITTRMSLNSHIGNPSNLPWAICIDHNMTVYQQLMLQATAPFSIGVSNPSKVAVAGAHTSLYDLKGKSLMSTSLSDIQLFTNSNGLWPAGATPSGALNADFNTALSACSRNDCTAHPTIIHGDTFIAAFRLTDPSSGLDLLLVSSTPRKYFLGDADTSRNVSIVVAVVCCAVIVAGCVALLLAIGTTLRGLQKNMLLASELRTSLVVHTPSRLTEIAELSAVFDDMNQRLTIARSFVPEAILLGQESEDTNDDDHLDESSLRAESEEVAPRHSSALSKSSKSSGLRPAIQDQSSSFESSLASEKMSKLLTISEKRVAILSLNLVGFNRLTLDRAGPRSQRVSDITSRLLSIVVSAAQSERGVMDSFHGDHFIVSFNATRAVGNGLVAAVRTANAVGDEVRRDSRFAECLGLAAGAASGKAQIGSLGIDGHRRFSIVGSVYRNAIALQAVCAQFLQKTSSNRGNKPTSPGCFVDGVTVKEIGDCGLYMQLCGVGVSPTSVEQRTLLAAHVQSTKAGDDDEWLYELDAMQAGDPFVEANRAMQALMDGNVAQCKEILATSVDPEKERSSTSLSRSGLEVTSVLGDSLSQLSTQGRSNRALLPIEALLNLYERRVAAQNARQPPGQDGGTFVFGNPWEFTLY